MQREELFSPGADPSTGSRFAGSPQRAARVLVPGKGRLPRVEARAKKRTQSAGVVPRKPAAPRPRPVPGSRELTRAT